MFREYLTEATLCFHLYHRAVKLKRAINFEYLPILEKPSKVVKKSLKIKKLVARDML